MKEFIVPAIWLGLMAVAVFWPSKPKPRRFPWLTRRGR